MTYERETLSEEDLAISVSEFSEKYGIHRSTAHRWRKQGWRVVGHHNTLTEKEKRVKASDLPPPVSLAPGDSVNLTAEEMKLAINSLRDRYRIGEKAAKKALETGILTKAIQTNVKGDGGVKLESPPNWTAATQASYDPSRRNFRINLAPAECRMNVAELVKLYDAFGLTEGQAQTARRRGYFCPNVDMEARENPDADAFEAFAEEALDSAEVGAKIALHKYFGEGWRQKMKGYDMDELIATACERLRKLSGDEGFVSESWRRTVAKVAVLHFLTEETRRKKKESTTVDQLEGRFDEE